MSTIKIEHVNPLTGKPVAFDILAPDSGDVRETFILTHGQSRLFDLSGGLVLREVSQEELAERARKIREREELEAEVARERKAKEDAAHAEQVAADHAAAKAEIERLAAEGAGEGDGDQKPESLTVSDQDPRNAALLEQKRLNEPKAGEAV